MPKYFFNFHNRSLVGAMGGGGRNYGPPRVFLRTARVLLLTIAFRKLDTEMGPKGPPGWELRGFEYWY